MKDRNSIRFVWCQLKMRNSFTKGITAQRPNGMTGKYSKYQSLNKLIVFKLITEKSTCKCLKSNDPAHFFWIRIECLHIWRVEHGKAGDDDTISCVHQDGGGDHHPAVPAIWWWNCGLEMLLVILNSEIINLSPMWGFIEFLIYLYHVSEDTLVYWFWALPLTGNLVIGLARPRLNYRL